MPGSTKSPKKSRSKSKSPRKSSSGKRKSKSSRKSSGKGPTYSQMIHTAVSTLNEKGGSTR